MEKELFSNWLKNKKEYGEKTVSSRASDYKRIQNVYGDLDDHYAKDRLKSILDELNNKNHKIKIDGDYDSGTATLKQALNLYVEFKDSIILDNIMNAEDIDPDSHDGSYQLIRETVESLSKVDKEKLDIKDLNLLYGMAIGTWKLNFEGKSRRIEDSNLPDNEKTRLSEILKNIEERASKEIYSNRIDGKGTVGMFGTGFFVFDRNSNTKNANEFLNLCVDIKDISEDEEEKIFNIAESKFKDGIRGVQASSASIMLHCLKPTVFPILNGAYIEKLPILERAGVKLDKANLLTKYIDNSRKIKEFRDSKCKFENYRVLDIELLDFKDSKEIIIDFNNHLNIDSLYFEDKITLEKQIANALKSGKSIILIGPPGTGKSKLATCIAESYKADSKMVTAMSDWSSYDTIGGYKPDGDGRLYFDEGIFLNSLKGKMGTNINKWLIIDEINRADIDKAFGPFLSALSGDDIELGLKDKQNRNIELVLEKNLGEDAKSESNQYVIPEDWRIIGTMNTFDKTSLYEMSYAFMRRFAFIPVAIPRNIDSNIVKELCRLWEIEMDGTDYRNISDMWKIINKYRKVGPAIIEDIAKFIELDGDYTSSVVIYILPQLEGIFDDRIKSFVKELIELTFINDIERLKDSVEDFFNMKLSEK